VNDNYRNNSILWQVASDILTSQYGDDNELWADVEREALNFHSSHGFIVALAQAKPESVALSLLSERDRSWRLVLSPDVYFRLLCAVAPSEKIVEYIESMLPKIGRGAQYDFGWLYRPLAERLRRDDELKNLITALNRKTTSRSFAAILVSILSAIHSSLDDTDLKSRLLHEVAPASVPAFGYDLRISAIRPYAHVLLDLLAQWES
jgi:hypothetical protein